MDEIIEKISCNDPNLTSLDLSKNKINDGDIKKLTLALQCNKTLTSLNLYHNEITDIGAKELILALKDNHFLTSLDLRENKISICEYENIEALITRNNTAKEALLDAKFNNSEKVEHLLNQNADSDANTLHESNQTTLNRDNNLSTINNLSPSISSAVDTGFFSASAAVSNRTAILFQSSAALELPKEVLMYILNFNDHWSLINSRRVCKSWRNKLNFSTFNTLEEIYKNLCEIEVEGLIINCSKDIKSFQTLLMSAKLLQRLTLDQFIAISGSSYRHAEMTFKSKLFHNNAEHKPQLKLKPEYVGKETPIGYNGKINYNEYEEKSYIEFSLYIINSLMDANSTKYFFNRATLKRIDLVEEELLELDQDDREDFEVLSSKQMCRAYIARSLAEKDVNFLNLAAQEANFAFNKKRLLKFAMMSIINTRAILKNEWIAKDKLDAQMMIKITSFSQEHKKVFINYAIFLLSTLPLVIAEHQPELTSNVAALLLQGYFFNANYNAIWKRRISLFPELARRAQEILKFLPKETYLPFILSKIIEISPQCAEAVLSVKGIKPFLNINKLKRIAKKDSRYNTMFDDLISEANEDEQYESKKPSN